VSALGLQVLPDCRSTGLSIAITAVTGQLGLLELRITLRSNSLFTSYPCRGGTCHILLVKLLINIQILQSLHKPLQACEHQLMKQIGKKGFLSQTKLFSHSSKLKTQALVLPRGKTICKGATGLYWVEH